MCWNLEWFVAIPYVVEDVLRKMSDRLSYQQQIQLLLLTVVVPVLVTWTWAQVLRKKSTAKFAIVMMLIGALPSTVFLYLIWKDVLT